MKIIFVLLVIAFLISDTETSKLLFLGTSIVLPAFISVTTDYMPTVGGKLITLSPGSIVSRAIRSISPSAPAPATMLSEGRPV